MPSKTSRYISKNLVFRMKNSVGWWSRILTSIICGGLGEMCRKYPDLRIACGLKDRELVESPDHLFSFRYDHYRAEHGIFYDPATAADIRGQFSGDGKVTLGLLDGEVFRLGSDRLIEVVHLPGHSHGHLGLYDVKERVLFYGDAIQGAGYESLTGGWTLCPTYLYVDAYLQTIRRIENLGAETIVGCHWPVKRGREQIREFCAVSRNFVESADRLIHAYLDRHPAGVTLHTLCEAVGSQLGSWPDEANRELCYAFLGHLEQGIAQGSITADHSRRPVVYRLT